MKPIRGPISDRVRGEHGAERIRAEVNPGRESTLGAEVGRSLTDPRDTVGCPMTGRPDCGGGDRRGP